jgi:uncharacterized damage-inducible protein DinB
MFIRQYLIETFEYNDAANKMALRKMGELAEKDECIRFFSHLINSMNKWLARIEQTSGYVDMDWWLPVYKIEELEPEWEACLKRWIDLLNTRSDEDIEQEVRFVGYDGAMFAATFKDIALQLNYHSIHHRAQIQYLIRQQGVEPDFVDYIGTKYRRLV